MDYAECAVVYKALGDKMRLEIIQMLKQRTMCACEILEKFSITQPTLSHHMKSLTNCGLVNSKKKGTWIHYSLNEKILGKCINFLMENRLINE